MQPYVRRECREFRNEKMLLFFMLKTFFSVNEKKKNQHFLIGSESIAWCFFFFTTGKYLFRVSMSRKFPNEAISINEKFEAKTIATNSVIRQTQSSSKSLFQSYECIVFRQFRLRLCHRRRLLRLICASEFFGRWEIIHFTL